MIFAVVSVLGMENTVNSMGRLVTLDGGKCPVLNGAHCLSAQSCYYYTRGTAQLREEVKVSSVDAHGAGE